MTVEDNPMSGEEQHVGKNLGSAESGVPRQSRLGKASFFLALASLMMIIFFGCILPVGALVLIDHTDVQGESPAILFGVVAPLGFLAVPVMSLTGVCLGKAGLLRKNCRRGLSIAGLILNSLILFAFALICIWWIAAIDDMIAC